MKPAGPSEDAKYEGDITLKGALIGFVASILAFVGGVVVSRLSPPASQKEVADWQHSALGLVVQLSESVRVADHKKNSDPSINDEMRYDLLYYGSKQVDSKSFPPILPQIVYYTNVAGLKRTHEIAFKLYNEMIDKRDTSPRWDEKWINEARLIEKTIIEELRSQR